MIDLLSDAALFSCALSLNASPDLFLFLVQSNQQELQSAGQSTLNRISSQGSK